MAKPERKEYTDYKELPEGESFLVVILQADVELSSFKRDDGSDKQIVRMIWEALEEDYAGSRVWASPGFTLHPKAPLRAIAQACVPRDMTEDELWEVFDTDRLPGKIHRMTGKYGEPNEQGRRFLKPTIYKRASQAEKDRYMERAAELVRKFKAGMDESPAEEEPAQEPEPATTGGKATKIEF
jgi:hypothetical protein